MFKIKRWDEDLWDLSVAVLTTALVVLFIVGNVLRIGCVSCTLVFEAEVVTVDSIKFVKNCLTCLEKKNKRGGFVDRITFGRWTTGRLCEIPRFNLRIEWIEWFKSLVERLLKKA